MRNSSRATRSTNQEHPDMPRSFLARLREYLASGSGRSETSYPMLQPPLQIQKSELPGQANMPDWLARHEGERAAREWPEKDEARRALEAADPWLGGYAYSSVEQKPKLGPAPAFLDLAETARCFAVRYTRDMGEAEARAQAWRDSLEWRRRLIELEGVRDRENNIYRSNLDGQSNANDKLHAEIRDERLKLRNALARADVLNAAIQYACGDGGLYWLEAWNEGEEQADDMLREWMETDDGRAALGLPSAKVDGRDGMRDVPPPVGRDGPEPARMFSTDRDPGDETHAKAAEAPVPLHPPPLSRDGMCSAYNKHIRNEFCSRDPISHIPCKICPAPSRGIFEKFKSQI